MAGVGLKPGASYSNSKLCTIGEFNFLSHEIVFLCHQGKAAFLLHWLGASALGTHTFDLENKRTLTGRIRPKYSSIRSR